MKSAITHGVSFTNKALLRATEKRASSLSRSLSGYVCWLISKDINGEETNANKSSRKRDGQCGRKPS